MTFRGNLFAFSLGKGGDRNKKELMLNYTIKYFSTTASELSVCTGKGSSISGVQSDPQDGLYLRISDWGLRIVELPMVLGIEARVSCMLGKEFLTKLYPQTSFYFLF